MPESKPANYGKHKSVNRRPINIEGTFGAASFSDVLKIFLTGKVF
jgi:hypothetical protein